VSIPQPPEAKGAPEWPDPYPVGPGEEWTNYLEGPATRDDVGDIKVRFVCKKCNDPRGWAIYARRFSRRSSPEPLGFLLQATRDHHREVGHFMSPGSWVRRHGDGPASGPTLWFGVVYGDPETGPQKVRWPRPCGACGAMAPDRSWPKLCREILKANTPGAADPFPISV